VLSEVVLRCHQQRAGWPRAHRERHQPSGIGDKLYSEAKIGYKGVKKLVDCNNSMLAILVVYPCGDRSIL
jgi:hypothetical protein